MVWFILGVVVGVILAPVLRALYGIRGPEPPIIARLLRGEFSRINGKVWAALLALSLFSGPIVFITMWVTGEGGHPLYTLEYWILVAMPLFIVATSKKVTSAMLLLVLLVPFVWLSLWYAAVLGSCFFRGHCL